jgi:hypothetical protein
MDNLNVEIWMSPDTRYSDNWSLTLGWRGLLLAINRVITGREPGVRANTCMGLLDLRARRPNN